MTKGDNGWGLALGGGGLLGFAHIGVLIGLNLHGLNPSVISGTSAGGMIAGLLAAGVNVGGIQHEVLAFSENILRNGEPPLLPDGPNSRDRPDRPDGSDGSNGSDGSDGASTLALKGMLGGSLVEAWCDRVTGQKKIADALMPVAITSVDVETGEEIVFTNQPPLEPPPLPVSSPDPPSPGSQSEGSCPYHTCVPPGKVYLGDVKISEAIRASISLPGVFVPKRYRERMLVDGGVRNMVPADEAKRIVSKVVAVDLGSHADKFQKVGGLIGILSRCFSLATRREVERSLSECASIVLQPEVWDVGFPTPTKARQLIDSGKACVEQNLELLIEVLG